VGLREETDEEEATRVLASDVADESEGRLEVEDEVESRRHICLYEPTTTWEREEYECECDVGVYLESREPSFTLPRPAVAAEASRSRPSGRAEGLKVWEAVRFMVGWWRERRAELFSSSAAEEVLGREGRMEETR